MGGEITFILSVVLPSETGSTPRSTCLYLRGSAILFLLFPSYMPAGRWPTCQEREAFGID
jgi:hypothetical protein